MSSRPARFLIPLLVGLAIATGTARSEENGCVAAQCHATLLSQKTVHAAAEGCDTCHESVATPHPQKGKKTFKLSQDPPELCFTCHDAFGKKADVHPPVKDGACTTCHDPHASSEPKLLVQPLKDLCATCHDAVTQFKNLHGPVSAGDCTACHNPHESDVKPLLVKKADELCEGCHLDVGDAIKKPHVHPALEGGCTSCHNPHGAAYPKLLADSGAGVCYACHSDVQEAVEKKGAVVHGAVKSDAACASCHSPHASDQEKLLLRPREQLCVSCHANVVPKTATVVHRPIQDTGCTSCHDPHAGAAKLLVREFPIAPYVAYTDQEYALCFGCHKRDLVQFPDTSFATGFRDGERNLHYLHVNRPKGRSCVLCHEVHGGTSPKLIAASVPFGSWSLPIKFVKTETGGSCAPGCHKPESYDRKSAGKSGT